MKRIDFTQQGGFPLTQDTLAFMQQGVQDVVRAFYAHLLMNPAGRYIFAGVYDVNGSLSSGWAIADGELLYVTGGQGDHLVPTTNSTPVIFEDNSTHPVYQDKYLAATQDPTGAYPLSSFVRVNGHRTVTQADCNYLAGRSFSYPLPELVASIHLERSQGEAVSGGFILNRIEPFPNIQNGHSLLVKLGNATGLTFLERNGVSSNIRFMRSTTPAFGAGNFVGTLNTTTQPGIGYDFNVHVKLEWNEQEEVWVETFRSGMSGSV